MRFIESRFKHKILLMLFRVSEICVKPGSTDHLNYATNTVYDVCLSPNRPIQPDFTLIHYGSHESQINHSGT